MTSSLTTDTFKAAHGRWKEILLTIGAPVQALNGKSQPCPMCGGEDRFTFTNRTGEGDYVCRGCGAGKGMKLLIGISGMSFQEAARKVDEVVGNLPPAEPVPVKPTRQASKLYLRQMWATGRKITPEDPVGLYLAARGLTLAGHGGELRYVPALPHYPTRTVHPGMLAKFRDATGETKQLQRTYLTAAGHKATVEPNRMFMPGDMPSGGAVRLGGPAETMGVAEGMETALAASQRFGMVVWATTSAGMLVKWVPPPEARHITVFGDNDSNAVGQCAAWTLARHLLREARGAAIKLTVEVRIPDRPDTDWADQ